MERSYWLHSELQSDDERRHALAHSLGVPFVQLHPEQITLEALLLVPEPLARAHNAVAYRFGPEANRSELEVALLSLDDLEHLQFLTTRYRLLPRLTSRAGMVQALLHYQKQLRAQYGESLQAAQSPNLLDTLLRHALQSHASDIHLESGEKGLLVRYRVHGSLLQAFVLPQAAGKNILGKLRALCGISGNSLREARLKVDLGHGEDLSLRVHSLQTVVGEKMVLQIAREGARKGWSLQGLGLHGEALERLHHFLNKRKGLLVVEGAPGSGPHTNPVGVGADKTTLLYTLLDLLNVPELSLATLEARVARVLPRVAQVEPGALSPAAALRGVLRSDPDVVMIDGVESSEVAALAAAAASRGILVLACVEDASLYPQTQMRVRTATVRKLCDKHLLDKRKLTRAQADELESRGARFAQVLGALKEEEKVDKDTAWKDLQFARAVGCSHCEGTGYQGQIGLHEVWVGEELVGLNLVEDGLFKAAQGLTSVDEVLTL